MGDVLCQRSESTRYCGRVSEVSKFFLYIMIEVHWIGVRWANQRKVFGRPLSSQAVVRNKLAHMIARVETTQTWVENVTYQMTHMSYKEQAMKLPGWAVFPFFLIIPFIEGWREFRRKDQTNCFFFVFVCWQTNWVIEDVLYAIGPEDG